MTSPRQSKWDLRFLQLAEFVSKWSKDPSTKVGAVIASKKNRIISIGYNGLPQGVEDSDERLNNRDLKYKLVVHGEINALLFAEKGVVDATLYTWPFMPCSNCASQVIQAGITRVIAPRSDNPRWQEGFKLSTDLFNEAKVELILLDDLGLI
jgi:dCMP deaminase